MNVAWYFKELLKIFHQQLTSEVDAPLVREFARNLRLLQDQVFEGKYEFK
jgi:hypothetical protein